LTLERKLLIVTKFLQNNTVADTYFGHYLCLVILNDGEVCELLFFLFMY